MRALSVSKVGEAARRAARECFDMAVAGVSEFMFQFPILGSSESHFFVSPFWGL